MTELEESDRTLHLEAILAALPKKQLDALIQRLDLRIDRAKRIDPSQQAARLLLSGNEARDLRLPGASRDLLHRVAERGGRLHITSLPGASEALIARGLIYVHSARGKIELRLPTALMLQLRSWDGEDPRCMRALLSQAAPDAQAAIAGYYLGRTAPPPIALSLETAWDALSSTERLKSEISVLAPTEQRVLDSIERSGGEVFTEELLELEREPLRLRTTTGAAASRRGVGFSLERRGLLIPIHPNRHVIPTEVSNVIAHGAKTARTAKRTAIRSLVSGGEHDPRRAQFSVDPSALVLALSLAVREIHNEVKTGVGTPKSLVQKLALRFGKDPEQTALLVSLSRSLGLWDVMALHPGSPPGEFTVSALFGELFRSWKRGGAWDEGRRDGETLRIAVESRDASPATSLRLMVLEAFAELGEERWIPMEALAKFIASDERIPAIERLFGRWATRAAIPCPSTQSVVERIVLESLPALGALDVGESDSGTPVLRLTPRGRAMIHSESSLEARSASQASSSNGESAKFLDSHVLRIGGKSRVADVLMLGPFVEIGKVEGTLDLIVAPQTLARALSSGLDADALRARIEAVASLPDTLSQTLTAASIVVGRVDYVASQGFLWAPDARIRDLLRTRRTTADLFVDPSPAGGLLVQAGIELEKLVKRCRTIGIEIVFEGSVLRVQTLPPPAVRVTPQAGIRVTKR
jgi:hypothetical protein